MNLPNLFVKLPFLTLYHPFASYTVYFLQTFYKRQNTVNKWCYLNIIAVKHSSHFKHHESKNILQTIGIFGLNI